MKAMKKSKRSLENAAEELAKAAEEVLFNAPWLTGSNLSIALVLYYDTISELSQ